MRRKQNMTLFLLAVFLFFPFAGMPKAIAQVDITPELAFDLWVLSWDDISVATGTGIKLQMDEIGIDMTVKIMDDGPMYEGIYALPRVYTIYEMSHGYGSVPDHVWDRMHSENDIDWGSNCYGIHNDTLDTALDEFMGATPATVDERARLVQLYAKENIPYIPLFLSDDTHAIRAEWKNYTKPPGGPFTSYNPRTMVFMYDENWPAEHLFVMAYPSDIGELNPIFYRSERSHWYDMLVYDTLITYDDNLDPIPWLAEDWALSADGQQVNFTVRDSVKWHDGVDLTVHDVNFTFHYWKNAPEDANDWAFLQHITSTDIDGNTVVVNLDQPFTFALQTLGELYILPKHIREGIAADDGRWDDATTPLNHTGSGPFKFVERTPGEYTELERFDDWWGPDEPEIGQLPNIDTVRIDVVVGQDARILSMRQGTADSERYEVFGPYVTTILNAPELDLVTGVVSQWDYVLGFNLTIPGFDDLALRKAIAYAINRQQLVDIGRLGFGTATNNTIPYEFFPSYYHSDGAFYEYDVDMANEILDDAGYDDIDGDGIREFPGATIPTTETTPTTTPTTPTGTPTPTGPDYVTLVGVAAGALIVGVILTFLFMRRKP